MRLRHRHSAHTLLPPLHPMESFRQPQHTAWHGRCLAVLRPKGASGTMRLTAQADGLSIATVVVTTRD
jgi:beta-galactosidase